MKRTRNLFPLYLTILLLLLQGCASDKPIYRGETLSGQPHGTGKKIFSDGTRYEGNWEYGQYSGQGVLTWADKISRYEGQFAAGQRSGQGKMTYPNGATYNGAWKNDKRHGHGIFILADGTRYDCEWQDDAAHGQCTQQLSNGNLYLGHFTAGQRNGDGAAVTFYDSAASSWCLENCSASSSPFAVVSGNFINGNAQSPTVIPCGNDRDKCIAMLPTALAAIAKERERKLAAIEAEKKRKEAEAEAERKRKEAAILAEQKRKEEERLALLNSGSAAQVFTYADQMESDRDYTKATEAYRIMINRFPESPFAAAAMTRLGAIRDKRDQQEAEQKRLAREEEIRKSDEQRRQQEAATRKAEREAEAAQREADRQAMASQQQKSQTSAMCIEAAKALCDQNTSGFANIACKAAAGAGCN